MIEDKIKLINNREAVSDYLKINGISGAAKDKLLAKWDTMQAEPVVTAPEPEVDINTVKTSVIDDESIEVKED